MKEESTVNEPNGNEAATEATIPDSSKSDSENKSITDPSLDTSTGTETLSKRKRKKLLKLEKWESRKKILRTQEREKYKQKRKEAVSRGEPARTGPSRKELKRNKTVQSSNFISVAIDLSFDDIMIDKDISKCVQQLLRIYTMNRRSSMPIPLYFTGIQEGSKIEKVLQKHDGYKYWDVNIKKESYHEIFEKDKIVYLTSESENVLTDLEKDNVYIIGGLIDHNHHKGLCHKLASELGIKHARLPLDQHIVIKTRRILTINHVFEILLRISEGKPWQETLLSILPQRKGAVPKEANPGTTAKPNESAEIKELDEPESITTEMEEMTT